MTASRSSTRRPGTTPSRREGAARGWRQPPRGRRTAPPRAEGQDPQFKVGRPPAGADPLDAAHAAHRRCRSDRPGRLADRSERRAVRQYAALDALRRRGEKKVQRARLVHGTSVPARIGREVIGDRVRSNPLPLRTPTCRSTHQSSHAADGRLSHAVSLTDVRKLYTVCVVQ